MAESQVLDTPKNAEMAALQKFGLRWAVLAAWYHELQGRGCLSNEELAKRLETARVKVASGCFSSCEVACDLGVLEGLLVAQDASSPGNNANTWLDLLGRAMEQSEDVERLLAIPAVRFQYYACGFPCNCGA